MINNETGQIELPSITRSEKNGGFHRMFKHECRKVQDSAMRVQIVTSPLIITDSYRRGYDAIKWNTPKQLKKML